MLCMTTVTDNVHDLMAPLSRMETILEYAQEPVKTQLRQELCRVFKQVKKDYTERGAPSG